MIGLDLLSVNKYPRLSDVVDYWAAEKADKICMQEVGKQSYTYAQLKKGVDSLAVGLHDIGVTKGNTILTMLENSIECIEAWLAINKLGAIDVPVHTAYKGKFIQHIINSCESKYIFVNVEHVNTLIESLKDGININLILVGDKKGNDFNISENIKTFYYNDVKKPNLEVPKVSCSKDDIANVLFTSGTKNGTKGLILTYEKVRNQMISVADNMGLSEQDVAYLCFPMSHGNGKFANAGTLLLLGGSVVIIPKFSASNWIHDIKRYRITYTSLMGPMAEFVYNQVPTEYDHNNDLRVILTVPRNPDFTPKFEERFGVDCKEVYGQVGLTAPIVSQIGENKNYASCGKLKKDYWDAKIVDSSTGLEVNIGETGELWLRPKKEGLIATGYYNDLDSFEHSFRDGWFMTGDLMSIDVSGYYYYKGRTGSFIRHRGENISAQEVEMVIKNAIKGQSVAVIGVQTEFLAGEEDVMAIVEGEEIDIKLLIEQCERELPAFAIPGYWLNEALPRLPDHTIDKQLLKNRGVTSNTFDRYNNL